MSDLTGGLTNQGKIENIQTSHVEELYFDILKGTMVLDPAVGSGAFLLAVQDVLIDIYLQCLEYFERMHVNEMSWELSDSTRDEIDSIGSASGSKTLHAKRKIILNNLYGVDVDEGAVEICKLRLWLSMVADIENDPDEVEPLPNIDFNIRQGNALMGFTDIQEYATEDGDESLNNYGADVGYSIPTLYKDVIDAIDKHRSAQSSKAVAEARNEAESLITQHSKSLNDKILNKFHNAGIDNVDIEDINNFSPFHWILEFAPVYDSGGFDILIGNPPWDRLKPSRDDYFSKYEETFRAMMPEEKDAKQEELLREQEIRKGWEDYQNEMNIRGDYYSNSSNYRLQSPDVGGRSHGTENDLSALFLERDFALISDDGYVAQILPGAIFNGSSTKDLRMKLLNETTITELVTFENHGIFKDIDSRYNFGITVFKNSGSTEKLRGIFSQKNTNILSEIDEEALEIPRRVLEQYSPEARIFPMVNSQMEVNVLNTILKHDPISESVDGSWYAEPYRELDRTQDSDRFIQSPEHGDYPVLGGSNIFQYNYDPTHMDSIDPISFWSVEEQFNPEKSAKKRIRERNYPALKRKLYEEFDGKGTQKAFVNQLLESKRGRPLSEEDVLLDCSEYRIVYRDIARSADERTMISAVIPKEWVCHNKLHTIRPYEISLDSEAELEEFPLHNAYSRIFTDEELFALLGMLNSIPFDFLMRTKIDTTVVMYKFEESQVPHLTEGDEWFNFISTRAAKLNCYGEPFSDLRERLGGISPITDHEKRIQVRSEIDAAAFHAYGLSLEEAQFILDDFQTVTNPRIMDDEYFNRVLREYEQLADESS
jgi:hypothetical protein